MWECSPTTPAATSFLCFRGWGGVAVRGAEGESGAVPGMGGWRAESPFTGIAPTQCSGARHVYIETGRELHLCVHVVQWLGEGKTSAECIWYSP